MTCLYKTNNPQCESQRASCAGACMHGKPISKFSKEQQVELPSAPPSAFTRQMFRTTAGGDAHNPYAECAIHGLPVLLIHSTGTAHSTPSRPGVGTTPPFCRVLREHEERDGTRLAGQHTFVPSEKKTGCSFTHCDWQIRRNLRMLPVSPNASVDLEALQASANTCVPTGLEFLLRFHTYRFLNANGGQCVVENDRM